MLHTLALVATMHALKPGIYEARGRSIYVGMDGEPSAHPSLQYYDPRSGRFGTLRVPISTLRPRITIAQQKLNLVDAQGTLGFSLWYRHGDRVARPTILLLEGADDSTRAMGWIVPYFVAHGVNAVTYDQRGTGISAGNWRYASVEQKAADALAMLDVIRKSAHVESGKIGLFGPSSGGWVAPIVAQRTPIAFMILKSAPAESMTSNILYEVRQVLREHRLSTAETSAAMRFESATFHALQGRAAWNPGALAAAQRSTWFGYLRIPPGFTEPPSAPMLAILKNALLYDPSSTLARSSVPTLALYGALDRNVDVADSAARLIRDYARSGERDLTVHVFAGTDHLLERTNTGYEDAPLLPARLAPGYPRMMIDWLVQRGILPH